MVARGMEVTGDKGEEEDKRQKEARVTGDKTKTGPFLLGCIIMWNNVVSNLMP